MDEDHFGGPDCPNEGDADMDSGYQHNRLLPLPSPPSYIQKRVLCLIWTTALCFILAPLYLKLPQCLVVVRPIVPPALTEVHL
ncbi:hypothetical protein PAXRUDRAFT_16170 [Paxillus rubicundulus Ve08.2h10]|uniref:Unplaced genomic scaffold scaffold_1377, whole genome shotgun sequence n=1 Tax=Paxillus rubicundulus Ve08.2h10 TaxID=930991 RepID=A0A0D0CA05_9AGAM|nr:hypothetical protein PAXRUDRAFT_16170 [Paxillus rubicundulus Ve08.2h10]